MADYFRESSRLLDTAEADLAGTNRKRPLTRAVTIVGAAFGVFAIVGVVQHLTNHTSTSTFLRASSALAFSSSSSSSSSRSNIASGNPSDLSVRVTNHRYPDYPGPTKYPFLDDQHGILIEPHRKMTLAVESTFSAEAGVRYTWEVGVTPKDKLHRSVMSPQTQIFESHKLGTEDDDEETSHTVVVELTQTGAYSLVLTEERFDGAKNVASRTTITRNIYCKYVRREIRSLNEEDRERFLDAAHTLWTVSTRRGREELGYGDAYRDITSLSLIHNDLAGNPTCDHLHGNFGYNFVTGHVAMNNMFEQAMQAVDPTVSLPYWSYVSDSAECRTRHGLDSECVFNLWDSDIFSEKYFGGHGTNRIEDGRWGRSAVPVLNEDTLYKTKPKEEYVTRGYHGCYGQVATDEGSTLCDFEAQTFFTESGGDIHLNMGHVMNAFGLVRSPWNMNSDEHVMRSGDFCGRKNSAQFPECESVVEQQDKFNTFEEWVREMQFSPHGAVHTFVAGATGGCGKGFDKLKPFLSESLLTRLIAKNPDITKNMFLTKESRSSDITQLVCPAPGSCKGKSQGEVGCTCSCPALADIDPKNVTHGTFENIGAFKTVIGFLDSSQRAEIRALSPEHKFQLLVHICEDDTLLGEMLSSSSPYDVTFFHLHAEVERIWQRKELSGTLTDVTWPEPGNKCPGNYPDYRMRWMDYAFDGSSSVRLTSEEKSEADESGGSIVRTASLQEKFAYSSYMRNDEFLAHLSPSKQLYAETIPYVYDEFKWRGCIESEENLGKTWKQGSIDGSLMSPHAWIAADELEWLSALVPVDERTRGKE